MSENQTIDDAVDEQTDEADQGIESREFDEPVQIGSSRELDSLVDTADVVLTDFYADWCGPCKMIAPVVADLAAETDAVVAKVDVDANQQLAAQYGVRGVPTLVLFADGEAVEQVVGAQPKERLRSLIEDYQ